jgi:hypothetical protein
MKLLCFAVAVVMPLPSLAAAAEMRRVEKPVHGQQIALLKQDLVRFGTVASAHRPVVSSLSVDIASRADLQVSAVSPRPSQTPPLGCFSAACKTALGAMPLTTGASTNWMVVSLNPPQASESVIARGGGGQQSGYAVVAGLQRASVWSGTAESWIDLHPAAATQSYASSISDGQAGGWAVVDRSVRASLWANTAWNWIDLTPPFAVGGGQVIDVSSGKQVGYIYPQYPGPRTASLWAGSAESWNSLNPTGATDSVAFGVDGELQVGFAEVGGVKRASLWSGTSGSWVDLHPAGTSQSFAFDVDAGTGKQVGYAYVNGGADRFIRASLWSGSAQSWVDLSPVGTNESYALAIGDGKQAGYVRLSCPADGCGFWRASLWSGTASSWINLHVYLPGTYQNSDARAISRVGTKTYVYGTANKSGLPSEAVVWILDDHLFSGGFESEVGVGNTSMIQPRQGH